MIAQSQIRSIASIINMKLNRLNNAFVIVCAAIVIAACFGKSTLTTVVINGSVSSGDWFASFFLGVERILAMQIICCYKLLKPDQLGAAAKEAVRPTLD